MLALELPTKYPTQYPTPLPTASPVTDPCCRVTLRIQELTHCDCGVVEIVSASTACGANFVPGTQVCGCYLAPDGSGLETEIFFHMCGLVGGGECGASGAFALGAPCTCGSAASALSSGYDVSFKPNGPDLLSAGACCGHKQSCTTPLPGTVLDFEYVCCDDPLCTGTSVNECPVPPATHSFADPSALKFCDLGPGGSAPKAFFPTRLVYEVAATCDEKPVEPCIRDCATEAPTMWPTPLPTASPTKRPTAFPTLLPTSKRNIL